MAQSAHVREEEAQIIGEMLGIPWDRIDIDRFRRGMEVELERLPRDQSQDATSDELLRSGRAAYEHLQESRDYYGP